MNDATEPAQAAKGIQELIDRIREKGVLAGREESSRLVEDAEHRAEWIIQQAEEQATAILQKAEQDAEFVRKSGAESLELAYRDLKMKLRDELSQQFARQLSLLIVQELSEPETLKQLLISAAGRSKLPDEAVHIKLPVHAAGLDELREDPSQLKGGPLIEMVSEVTRELFSHGVEIGSTGRGTAGMVLSLRDGEVNVELTEQALADLILAHLQPRFRAILEGVVG